jgi:hypothetical protein
MGRLQISIEGLTLSDETRLDVPEDAVVVFVGANNVGKSRALRDLMIHISSGEDTQVVTRVDARKVGTAADIEGWLDAHHRVEFASRGAFAIEGSSGTAYTVEGWQREWDEGFPLPTIARFLMASFDVESRLSGANTRAPAQSDSARGNWLQEMYFDSSLEAGLNEELAGVTDQPVVLDRIAGQDLILRYGEVDAVGTLPPSKDYVEQMRALGSVREQGKGRTRVGGPIAASVLRERV